MACTATPLALVEQLDGAPGNTGLDLLAEQPMWYRVRMLLTSTFSHAG
jgi:hypothetical protein